MGARARPLPAAGRGGAIWTGGTARTIAFALALVAMAAPLHAQQPSASAIALAKEIIVAKGAATMYDPVVPSVIERAKVVFLQSNPMIGRDLNEVAARLR